MSLFPVDFVKRFSILQAEPKLGGENYKIIPKDKILSYIHGVLQKKVVQTSVDSALITIPEIDLVVVITEGRLVFRQLAQALSSHRKSSYGDCSDLVLTEERLNRARSR